MRVSIVMVTPRPKSMCGVSKRTGKPLQDPSRHLCTSKPDADNGAKVVLDALKTWWRDDAQVCDLRVVKLIAALDEAPHYEVRVTEIDGSIISAERFVP